MSGQLEQSSCATQPGSQLGQSLGCRQPPQRGCKRAVSQKGVPPPQSLSLAQPGPQEPVAVLQMEFAGQLAPASTQFGSQVLTESHSSPGAQPPSPKQSRHTPRYGSVFVSQTAPASWQSEATRHPTRHTPESGSQWLAGAQPFAILQSGTQAGMNLSTKSQTSPATQPTAPPSPSDRHCAQPKMETSRFSTQNKGGGQSASTRHGTHPFGEPNGVTAVQPGSMGGSKRGPESYPWYGSELGPVLDPILPVLEAVEVAPPDDVPVDEPLDEPIDEPPPVDETALDEEPADTLLEAPALVAFPAFVPELTRGPELQPAAKPRATRTPRLAAARRMGLPSQSMVSKSTPGMPCRAFSQQVGYAMALAKVLP